ncbi:MAG TPA: hypothetical protein VGO40_21450 [Longimicrobium sp.]|nr:hypothetical protein [Longimicrobium sp.]
MSLALLYRALFANTMPTVTPSPTGRYLAYDDSIPHAESGMEVASRYAALVFGVVIIGGPPRPDPLDSETEHASQDDDARACRPLSPIRRPL